MAFLVQRTRAANGDTWPDHDSHPEGVLSWENTPNGAIKAYARRVMPGASGEELSEGDEFMLYPVDVDAEQNIRVASRRVTNKFEAIDPS